MNRTLQLILRHRIRALRMDTCGSALVEGTVLTPFLCVLFFGVFEFSYFFYEQHLVSTGVRDAARYLARTDDFTDPTAQTTAQNLAATGSAAGGAARRVSGFNPANVTFSFTSTDNSIGVSGLRPYRERIATCGGPNSVRIINVTGSFTYAPLGFWSFFGFSVPTVSVTHSEPCIGRS